MTRAEDKKHHYIYKTTCQVNGKFYIGMHSTDDIEDGYKGSGKRLWYSIRKYGKENHTTEIIEFLPSRKQLKEREAQIVNEELLKDSACMNLVLGGEGGNGWAFTTKEQKSLGGKKGSKTFWANPVNVENHKKRSSEIIKRVNAEKRNGRYTFTGKKHSEETLAVMKEKKIGHGLGETNSQFGTCWMYSLEEQRSIKIDKGLLDEYVLNGWIKGRKTFQLTQE